MRYGSLCSGIGGFDAGFDAAGFTAAWQVEIDPKARQVLTRHWPAAKRYTDMRNVGGQNLEPVGIILGGTPCQSFSISGLRKGLSDERGNLTFEFCRICDELQPRIIVWENVPGVLSSTDNAFGAFLAGLVGADAPLVPPESAGGRWTNAGVVSGPRRAAAWCIKDAQFFGTPQRRRRVFVVASPDPQLPAQILFESNRVCGDHSAGNEAREGFAAAFGGGSETGRGPGDGDDGGRDGSEIGGERGCLTPWDMERFRVHSAAGVVPPLLANTNGGGQGVHTVAIEQGQLPEDATPIFKRRGGFGRSETVIRRLTPTECERLQGFPDQHTQWGIEEPPCALTGSEWTQWAAAHILQMSDSTRYKQCGNAVNVAVSTWLGWRVQMTQEELDVKRTRLQSLAEDAAKEAAEL